MSKLDAKMKKVAIGLVCMASLIGIGEIWTYAHMSIPSKSLITLLIAALLISIGGALGLYED